jgi:hypothetical protein
MATTSLELLQERIKELEEEVDTRAHEIEALEAVLAAVRQLHNEVEARLEEALRAELHANQDRELGHKIEQQMQFRDTMAADNLEALAEGLLSQDPAKLAEDKVELVVMLMMANQRLHELAQLLRKPILTISLGKPKGE